ncbi:MAG TPA: LptA/OstA family protein, partial [Treponemataceae bacterium]|nr:LptA/OstA family protein [Treponemataceae bacterium]
MKKKWLLVLAFLGAFFYTYSETIHFSGDSLVAKTSENSEYTSLDGNAEVKTDDLEIQADFIEISGKDFRFITASGRVSGKNLTSNFSFSCERLHYDRITKVALLESAVELHDTENDVQISAQSIEYNQKTDIATMQIEVRLTSKDSICTSALAIYNKAQQRVVLSGSPKIERNKDI